jgi:hypothetical protein
MDLGYIDPASGSMILQVLLGGAAAVAVALKMWWGRVLRFLHIRKPEDETPPIEHAESVAATPESESLDPAPEPVARG